MSSDREFLVSTFLHGSLVVDSATAAGARLGDRSQSLAVAVEQFRSRYVFLAPDDYDRNYVDVVTVDGNSLWLDGAALTLSATSIGDGLSVLRIPPPQHAHRVPCTHGLKALWCPGDWLWPADELSRSSRAQPGTDSPAPSSPEVKNLRDVASWTLESAWRSLKYAGRIGTWPSSMDRHEPEYLLHDSHGVGHS